MQLFRHRHLFESGRASQAGASGFVSTAFVGAAANGIAEYESSATGSLFAPAARMERGDHTGPAARAEQSAPPDTGRAPFGLHPLGAPALRFAATAGAPA
ncbi:hypothetical protein [Lysobacter sp. 1R34A]|uniref:hypothetical protein n=1 Tax=Lysobacter sp. 1R34A TaxID=3445786 RepID=UPI003EEBA9B7